MIIIIIIILRSICTFVSTRVHAAEAAARRREAAAGLGAFARGEVADGKRCK
jgi:hypothetical protein